MKPYLEQTFNFDDPMLVSALDELSLWSAPFGIKLLDVIKIKKNIQVLDVGFGLGFPLLEIAQRFGNTCKVSGIDPWQTAVKRTIEKINQYGIKNVSLVLGNAENMPFDDELFDLIVSNNGLNNVDDEKKSYAECYRICKKGGQFVFSFNLPGSMIEFYNVFEKVLFDFSLNEEISLMKKHISHKRKTIDETKALVETTGFNVKNVYNESLVWRYADGTTMLNNYFIKLAFMQSWKEIVKPADLDKVFNAVEIKMNEIAAKEGELKLTIPFAVFDCRK
jgi:arsenite methyltransferase